ncbi:MAG: hypothetical protein ACYDBJ_13345 [Aggregatilineales bacterium]
MQIADYLYYIHDESKKIDVVIVVPHNRQNAPHIAVMTRLEGEQVIIEMDNTDRPVEDALVASGLPRYQITVAWRGERSST